MWTRGEAPAETATLSLQIENLGCRGNATLLTYYLNREDELAIQGHVKLEAWPGPGLADARVIFDPAQTDDTMIKMAITEAVFDHNAAIWRPSPFRIEGYDPLGRKK